MQGWRLEMEDAHVATVGVGGKNVALFCVFDGHAGKLAALHAAANIGRILSIQSGFDKAIEDPESLGEALKETYSDIDDELLELPQVRASQDSSGCTAISICVTPSHYVVANAGDSRVILVSGGQVTFASRDHKPDDATETARILRAGGMVFAKRVNGDLAVSRALGDFMYKRVAGLPPGEQPVSSVPDITIIPRDVANDQFLAVACDGVWDVMSNAAAAQFFLEKMSTGYGLGRCCELLLDHCLEAGSRDNMTVVVAALTAAPKQIGTYREPAQKTPSTPSAVQTGSGGGGGATANSTSPNSNNNNTTDNNAPTSPKKVTRASDGE
jgi:protein phosphatase 1B